MLRSKSRLIEKKMFRAFTLLEVLIVCVVINILAAIAFPSYRNYLHKARWAENIQIIDKVRKDFILCLQIKGDLSGCDSLPEALGTTSLPYGQYMRPSLLGNTGNGFWTEGSAWICLSFRATDKAGSYMFDRGFRVDGSDNYAWHTCTFDTLPSDIVAAVPGGGHR